MNAQVPTNAYAATPSATPPDKEEATSQYSFRGFHSPVSFKARNAATAVA